MTQKMASVESMQAVANRVFNTPELLEIVLLKLPNAALLRLQRTHSSWHHQVKTSIHLRRKLYLAANSPAQASGEKIKDQGQSKPDINPLFARFRRSILSG